jgi:hypothetical protein
MQIQVARIQCRVPEYGWTTQKVFQFLNFVVNGGIQFNPCCRKDITYALLLAHLSVVYC